MTSENIDCFFNPKTIAVIGVSRNPGKFGHIIFRNLLDNLKKVYPVNPNAAEVLGKKCYPSIRDLPETELAVIAVPASQVVKAVADCKEKGVKAAIIITSGFAESGNASGEEMIKKVKGGMRIIGPNVIGIYDAYSCVDTVFNLRHRQQRPRPGGIAFVSQSGAFGSAVLDSASSEGVGLSKFVSLGNMLDVNETDMLDYLMKDKKTGVITMYVEGSKNYCALYEKLGASRKPVVIVKAGKTKQTEKAVASHTASLAGEAGIFSGMLRQAGCIEASADNLFSIAKAFSQPLPKNNRVQVVTDGGGFGILAADALVRNGLRLSKLSSKTVARIKSYVPPYASVSNPLDLTGDADTERYKNILPLVLGDAEGDAVIVILLMQISSLDSKIVNVIADAKRFGKPVLVCMAGGEYTGLHRKMLEEKGVPTYQYPESAADAIKALYSYSQKLRGKS